MQLKNWASFTNTVQQQTPKTGYFPCNKVQLWQLHMQDFKSHIKCNQAKISAEWYPLGLYQESRLMKETNMLHDKHLQFTDFHLQTYQYVQMELQMHEEHVLVLRK